MPLDPRVFGQFEAPDIMGGFERGLRMSSLIKENRAKEAEQLKQSRLRDLVSKNTVVAEDGSISISPNGLKALTQEGYVPEAMSYQNQNMAQQKNKMEFDQVKAKADLSEIGNSLGLIRQNPKLWESEVIRLRDKGIDVSRELNPDGTVKPFDPNHVEQLWKQTDQYSKHLDQQFKQSQTAENWAQVAATRNKPNTGEGLTLDNKKMVEGLASKNAGKTSVATQIDSYLNEFKNAKDEAGKIAIGRQMLKVLNSPEGADAIGAEEANRLGSKLEFALGNLAPWNSNPIQWGRDLEGFEEQAKATSQAIKKSVNENQKLVNQRMGLPNDRNMLPTESGQKKPDWAL
jgi:hypothetical protein